MKARISPSVKLLYSLNIKNIVRHGPYSNLLHNRAETSLHLVLLKRSMACLSTEPI